MSLHTTWHITWHDACDKPLMCFAWFAHNYTGAIWAYVLETVRGTLNVQFDLLLTLCLIKPYYIFIYTLNHSCYIQFSFNKYKYYSDVIQTLLALSNECENITFIIPTVKNIQVSAVIYSLTACFHWKIKQFPLSTTYTTGTPFGFQAQHQAQP